MLLQLPTVILPNLFLCWPTSKVTSFPKTYNGTSQNTLKFILCRASHKSFLSQGSTSYGLEITLSEGKSAPLAALNTKIHRYTKELDLSRLIRSFYLPTPELTIANLWFFKRYFYLPSKV